MEMIRHVGSFFAVGVVSPTAIGDRCQPGEPVGEGDLLAFANEAPPRRSDGEALVSG